VEQLAPSEMEEETAPRLRARDVGASATLGSFAHTNRKKDLYCLHPVVCHDVEKKVDGSTPGLARTLCGTTRDKWS
jgi:hypothetical protein